LYIYDLATRSENSCKEISLKKILFPEKETAERNFLYGYDVAESSSDVDATSYSSNSSESNAET
jgi:hypothetical protein